MRDYNKVSESRCWEPSPHGIYLHHPETTQRSNVEDCYYDTKPTASRAVKMDLPLVHDLRRVHEFTTELSRQPPYASHKSDSVTKWQFYFIVLPLSDRIRFNLRVKASRR